MKTYDDKKDRQIIEIKEDWFKNHLAKITKSQDIIVLDWQEPGTIIFSVRYVFDGYNMYVTGDLGEAVLRFTEKAVPEIIANYNIGYFYEKLRAFSSPKSDFDRIAANEYLTERMSEREYICEEACEELRSIIDDSDSVERYNINLSGFDIYRLGNDAWEWVSSIGSVIPMQIRSYLIGLQMATKELSIATG